MPSVTIQPHAIPSDDDITTSDKPTIDALRTSFPSPSNLVHAHELESALRPIRPLWAKVVSQCEESHMVRVVFGE